MNGYRTSYVTPAIRVVDAPISKKSPEQWKAIVEYKALAFTHDNQYASIAYDLKSARAVFDPNLAGGNGGFRCPVGTRYGGQITDRYGRGCGWGVARRLVNAIGDTARRAERGLEKRRERRVQRRNARVARQIGVRGYTAPARVGRGMATRLEDFADRRDRRQRRGRGGVPSGPGVATRLENFADRRDRRGGRGVATRLEDFADRRDRRQGRGGRGAATRLEDFADRRDRRQGRGGRGAATRLEDFADRRDRRQGRGIATRLEDFADRRDREQGVDVPERAPRTPKRPAKRPAAANRRSRRNEAVAETATNRPRPKRPSTPVAEVKPPQRRQRGPRVNVNDLSSAERMRLNDALDKERDALNAKWKTRLGGEDPTPEKIRAYVEAREQRSKPAYVNTLKAMERDHAILNGEDRLQSVNELAPSVRKRIIGGSIEDQGAARPQPPRAPRRPVKKRAVKKAAAKRPAKKAPAKKAPAKKAAAKKAAATRPENEPPSAPGAAGNAPEAPNTPESPEVEMPARQRRGRVGRLLEPYRGRPVRRRNKQRGAIADTNGKSRNIKNAQIRSEADAVAFVRDGGSLDKVPNEHWLAAISQNSSKTKVDPNSRFLELNKNGGIIGETRIFVVRGADGKSTDQGWVLKGARMKDTAAEIGSQYLAFRAGLPVEAAGWDGQGPHHQGGVVPYAVLPHAFNGLENGSVKMPTNGDNFDPAIFNDVPNKAHPERMANLLHNWLMGVSDRHGGNGMSIMRGGKPYAIPIDQGWAGRNVVQDPRRFAFGMDPRFFQNVGDHLSALQGKERSKQAREMISAYDGMLERAQEVVREGKQSYVRAVINGVNPNKRAEAKQRLEEIFDTYETQVLNMQSKRMDILRSIVPPDLHNTL